MTATPPLNLFSTLAVKKALDDSILDAFTADTGIAVEGTFDPTNVLLDRLDAGARPDVMIGVAESFVGLDAAIELSTVTPLARVGVGIAVAPGLPIPSLVDAPALVRALRNARSVAYSRTGASGIYFARLLDELGIADEINSRATIVEKGFTALAVLDGRADLAVQQLSELLFVPDAVLAGPLPPESQHYTLFAAALGVHTETAAARTLLDFLTSEFALDAYLSAGLEAPAPVLSA